jgi:hypothetical protein
LKNSKCLSSITKKGKIESASRPPCGFQRIDDQQLEIYPCVESFVVYDIQKGNTNDEIKFYMSYNEEKGKSYKDFLELMILYFI